MKYSLLPSILLAALGAAGASAQDFNGDGYADLAIAAPFEDVTGVADAGAVHVLYGGSSGPSGNGDQLISMQPPWYFADLEAGAKLGSALAWGDFNADGYDDLAIGAPGKDAAGIPDAGEVLVIEGSAAGLSGWDYWNLEKPYVVGFAAERDNFGFAVAAGDLDGDGYDDLAIGAPYADIGGTSDTGALSVLYGTSFGLYDTGNQHLYQPGSNAEAGDLLGYSLVIGHFDGDAYGDLAASAPLEDVGSVSNAGAVWILSGSSGGLPVSSWPAWHQESGAIQGAAESSDQFGIALASGDFNADGYQDLAVGVPYEDIGSVSNAGCIQVIRGGASGLTDVANQLFSQDTAGVPGTAGTGDLFGFSLAAGRLNAGGYDDLAIGVPWENVGSIERAGAVGILYGGRSALGTSGAQLLSQTAIAPLERSEVSDGFGWSVCVADFNASGIEDLVAGATYEDVGSIVDAGCAVVLFGVSAGVTASGAQVWNQNSTGILDAAETGDRLGAALHP